MSKEIANKMILGFYSLTLTNSIIISNVILRKTVHIQVVVLNFQVNGILFVCVCVLSQRVIIKLNDKCGISFLKESRKKL